MKTNESYQTTAGNALGALTMLAWFLVLGPLGALLLGGTAYFIVAENVAVAILCCALLLAPLGLTLVWGAMKLAEALRERRFEKTPFLLPPEAVERSSEPLEI